VRQIFHSETGGEMRCFMCGDAGPRSRQAYIASLMAASLLARMIERGFWRRSQGRRQLQPPVSTRNFSSRFFVMLDHSCQAHRHALAERGNDLYETPTCAVEALLRNERLPKVIWKPACGRGAIVTPLRAAGYEVIASDLVDYGIAITPPGYWRRDFLMERELPIGARAIVTNPPYKLAEQFVAHAIEICPLVIMLLRLAFYESERRSHILDNGALARIHVFRKRLPMMHRANWTGPKASSGIAFAWFV
jgi:hypothetical protein